MFLAIKTSSELQEYASKQKLQNTVHLYKGLCLSKSRLLDFQDLEEEGTRKKPSKNIDKQRSTKTHSSSSRNVPTLMVHSQVPPSKEHNKCSMAQEKQPQHQTLKQGHQFQQNKQNKGNHQH